MAPKKVLFPYVGDSVGGSHVSSLLLARALPPDAYTQVVACHEDGPLHGYLDGLGLAAVEAPRVAYPEGGALRRALQSFRARRALGRFLEEQAIALVHTNDMRMHMTWGPAARAAGVPHVWHQRTPARAAKHARAAMRASALLTVSGYCAESFPSAMRARAEVIYNPFSVTDPADRDAARARVQAELGLPPKARFVTYVANLAPRKRPEVFVALAAALAARGRADTHFLMLGEARPAQWEAVTKAIADQGLTGRCHLLGTRHPIEPWLAGSKLLVAPAVDEAFGRTLVEAMLEGTPVIASDAGGHREILRNGETGLLVAPDDGEALAQAALGLLSDTGRAAAMARAARDDAAARFSTPAHVRQIVEVYNRITRAR